MSILILVVALASNIPFHTKWCKHNCETKTVSVYWTDGTETKTKIKVCT